MSAGRRLWIPMSQKRDMGHPADGADYAVEVCALGGWARSICSRFHAVHSDSISIVPSAPVA